MKQDMNGLVNCHVSASWLEVKEKVEDMHTIVKSVETYLPHLENLDALAEIKNHLLDSATGRKHIETATAMIIFKILGGRYFYTLASAGISSNRRASRTD